VVQDIFSPFQPELHKDLTKFCVATGASYDYLKQEKLPLVYKKRWVINRIEVEDS
jgi:hypothetical protein